MPTKRFSWQRNLFAPIFDEARFTHRRLSLCHTDLQEAAQQLAQKLRAYFQQSDGKLDLRKVLDGMGVRLYVTSDWHMGPEVSPSTGIISFHPPSIEMLPFYSGRLLCGHEIGHLLLELNGGHAQGSPLYGIHSSGYVARCTEYFCEVFATCLLLPLEREAILAALNAPQGLRKVAKKYQCPEIWVCWAAGGYEFSMWEKVILPLTVPPGR